LQQRVAERALSAVAAMVRNTPKRSRSPYTSAVPLTHDADAEIRIDAREVTDLIRATRQDAADFRAHTLPALRAALPAEEGSQPEEIQRGALKVADREALLDVELQARGAPFTSLEEKFQTEERIEAVQEVIRAATHYPTQPEPERRSLDQLRLTLQEIAKLCQQEVKDALRS
jgi:intracellular multiplication protein IcmO